MTCRHTLRLHFVRRQLFPVRNQLAVPFFEGRREEAIPLVPTQFADEISLVGSKARIRERLEAWKDSPVTTIIVNGDLETLRTMAELAL